MEFPAGNHTYRTRKMDPFDQALLVKKLSNPVKNIISAELISLIRDKNNKDPLRFFVAFTEAAEKMPDEDFRFVLDHCLNVCQRKDTQDKWFPIAVDGVLRYQDITTAQMFIISYHVLQENLGSFFDELRSMLPGAEESLQQD